MSDKGTFERVARLLAEALHPLEEAVSGPEQFKAFLMRLGWLPASMPPAYAALGTAVRTARQKLESLDDSPSITEVLDLLQAGKAAFDAIRGIGVAPPGVDAGPFLAEIGTRLPEVLLTDFLAAELPALSNLLSALNVLSLEIVPPAGNRPGFPQVNLKWDQIPKILTNPGDIPALVFGWGTPHLRTDKIIDYLGELFLALHFPISIRETSEAVARGYTGLPDVVLPTMRYLAVPFYYLTIAGQPREAAVILRALPAANGKLPGIILEPRIPSEFPLTLHLADGIDLRLRAGTNVNDLFGLVIRPGEVSLRYPLAPGTPPPSAGVGIGFDFKPKEPVLLLGERDGTRLQFQGAKLDASATAVGSELEAVISAEMTGLALILSSGGADGFIQKIIGSGETKIDVPLGIEWSSKTGIHFKGGAAFEVRTAPHLSLGPIGINELVLRLTAPPGPQPKVQLEVAAGIAGKLGPLAFVVEEIGFGIYATFEPGNAGPLDLSLGFKPPIGIGLSVDAGVITGGGYLHIDTAKGEYFGALELSFQGIIALKAIGIITTKLPDGSKGFALLILITAEFAPIQLGFGFTLLGVGGLLALNRTLDTEALKVGVRTGAVNSILFPQDIVANIGRIISDLKTIFPIALDHFIIGPMGKLGWGTPTLISLELGVILDIPEPQFVLLGALRCILPAEELAILKLQVNFAGGIDFDRGLIWFDASLFDSRLLIYTLTGDMALRIGWGDQTILIITVGGFHPAFHEIPPDLQGLRRLTISLFSGDNPRLSVATYFAITSNTVQSGSRVELYAEGCGFNIYGYMGYDLLVQFNPFHFVANLEAGLALREGNDEILGVHVSAELSGPAPWRARGEASFRIIFKFSIDFDVTWGDDAEAQPEQLVDVFPLVEAALQDDRNWATTLPANSHETVTFRKVVLPPEKIILSPFAILAVSQKVVPLGLEINKFGNQRPEGATKFDLTFDGGGTQEVREEFAMANFQKFDDSERLSRKSFERLRSGLQFTTGDSTLTGANTDKEVTYEVVYVHRKRGLRIRIAAVKLFGPIFSMFTGAGAVSKSKLAVSRKVGGTPPVRVEVAEPKYAVVNVSDLGLHAADMVAATEAEAQQLHTQLLTGNPSLRGAVQVVSMHELN